MFIGAVSDTFSDVDWAAFDHLSLSDIGGDAGDVGDGGDGTDDASTEIWSTSSVDPFEVADEVAL